MLKLNCLINDTQAVQLIKDAIHLVVGDKLENGKSVKFPGVYRELRKQGLEVDAESAGSLYNEVFGQYNDTSLSSEDEISEYVGADVAAVQQSITDAITSDDSVEQQQIGKLRPEMQVATMIAKMFKDNVYGTTDKVKSVMKQMETLVSKAARTLLPPGQQKAQASLTENLNTFFKTEATEFQRLDGSTNTLRTLHDAVKDEVENYLNEATDTLSDEDAQALRDQWEKYTEGFMQSTYDIMLGKSDQNNLLNESLKQVEIDGLRTVDVNGNIKWSNLMEDNNPSRITEGVKKLFREGIKDKEGNVHKYSEEEAERIGNYFQRLYQRKLADVMQKKIGNVRSKNISSKNIISDFIKDRGFINLVKDKEGNLLLTQANWDDALKYMNLRAGDKEGVDHAVNKLREFLKTRKNKEGKSFTDQQMNIIEKEFRDSVAAKLAPKTATPGALERLIALKDLNNGRAFEKDTQRALNNVLGVSGLDQDTINKLQELVEVAQSIRNGNNVNNSSSTNPAVNRGAYAFQALSQVERRIKEIVRTNMISKDKKQAQRIVKYLGDLMNAASTSLLVNPGNVGENIVTAFASNLSESLLMLVTHPKLFAKTIGKSQGDFATALASHFSGGVANEVIVDSDISSEAPTGERLRARALGKELAKGSFGSALFKLPSYAGSMVARAILNDFDAGFNSALLRKKAALSMFNALKAQGMSDKEVYDAMDAALKIDPKTEKEISDANAAIKKKLNSVGIFPTSFDMMQNSRDMKLSLYEDAMQSALPKMTVKQRTEATKALIQSSQDQAKVLAGKKNIPSNELDFINRIIYGLAGGLLDVQRKAFGQQEKLEKEGKLGSAAAAQLGAEIWKNTFAKFAGGIANFLSLGITATPLGLITANALRVQKNRIKRDATKNATDILQADPGDIRKYAEAHQLMRSMVMRSVLGTMVAGGFVMAKLLKADDDDDDEPIENLMATKSGRRLMQKYLPIAVNVAAALLYDNDDKKYDTGMERVLDVLSNTTGSAVNRWSSIKEAMGRAKDDEERGKIAAGALGGILPTYNINQAEQITKFGHVLKSIVDKDGISDVERDEEITKAIYKEQENWIQAAMTNGAIEAMGRALGISGKPFNRFKEGE